MAEREECVICGVVFWMTDTLYKARRQDGRTFYCPNGHGMSYTETEADKLRRERDRLAQQQARLEDNIRELSHALDHEHRRSAAYKGQVTRLKTRANAGLCPCCNRHFTNLERHIASKHPDMLNDDGEPDLTVIEGGKQSA